MIHLPVTIAAAGDEGVYKKQENGGGLEKGFAESSSCQGGQGVSRPNEPESRIIGNRFLLGENHCLVPASCHVQTATGTTEYTVRSDPGRS